MGAIAQILPLATVRRGDRRAPAERLGVAVIAPNLGLEIVVADDHGGRQRVHLHPSGQGFWVARMVARLAVDVVLCAPIGGEPGRALRGLVQAEGIRLVTADLDDWSGVTVSHRPAGETATIAEQPAPALARHELDDLYGLSIAAALDARIAVLTGHHQRLLDPAVYGRLAHDIGANGGFVIADLSGDDLRAALDGGLGLVKVSDEELVAGGWCADESDAAIRAGIDRLRERADAVVVSRATADTLVADGDGLRAVRCPRFHAEHHRGAGDSMTAALAASLARGEDLETAARRAAAAAALNVTRRGLGTGDMQAIERLMRHVRTTGAPEPASAG